MINIKDIKTKEEACHYINEKYKKVIEGYQKQGHYKSKKIGDVKVPVYYSSWKKYLLVILQFLLKKRAFGQIKEIPKVSSIDFSKFVLPDLWVEYEVNDISKFAFPKYMKEHDLCWEVYINHEFMKEDLQYGVRPISIYFKIAEGGGGPVLLDKENGAIYLVGSGVWAHCNHIEDFSLYKKGKASKFDWSSPPNVYGKNNK